MHAPGFFVNMGIVPYLKSCMAIVECRWTREMLRNFTIIGLGRAHMTKIVVDWKEMRDADR